MSDAPAVPASPTAEPSPAAFSYPGLDRKSTRLNSSHT